MWNESSHPDTSPRIKPAPEVGRAGGPASPPVNNGGLPGLRRLSRSFLSLAAKTTLTNASTLRIGDTPKFAGLN